MARIIAMQQQELPRDGWIYKHSTTCSISASAAGVIESVDLDEPVHWVNVIEQRQISNWIAEQTGVRHQSPQLIRLRGGAIDGVWSHFDITAKSLQGAQSSS